VKIQFPETWWPWPDKLAVYQHIVDIWRELGEITDAVNELREKMASTDELVARFAVATDEIASDLQALRDEVAGLDAGVAAKFEPLVSRLEGLGADPENPVPEQ